LVELPEHLLVIVLSHSDDEVSATSIHSDDPLQPRLRCDEEWSVHVKSELGIECSFLEVGPLLINVHNSPFLVLVVASGLSGDVVSFNILSVWYGKNVLALIVDILSVISPELVPCTGCAVDVSPCISHIK